MSNIESVKFYSSDMQAIENKFQVCEAGYSEFMFRNLYYITPCPVSGLSFDFNNSLGPQK